MKRITTGCAAAAFFVISGAPALALTDTAQFQVTITIQTDCQISSATDLDFGTQGVLGAPVTSTSTVSVLCTPLTAYTLALDAGTGAGATITTRKMTGPALATVDYSIYQDAGHALVWGNTVPTQQVGVGTGVTQAFTAYGLVPAQTTPAPGTYTDTITATVTF